MPAQLHSDHGTNFESQLFKEVCGILGIQKTCTTPGRLQSNGMVERACRNVQAMLSANVAQNQKDWDIFIPLLMMAYHSSVHDIMRCKPCVVGWNSSTHRLSSGNSWNEKSKCERDYAYELEKQLVRIHDFARKYIQISSDGMKSYHDRKVNFFKFVVGGCYGK